MEKKKKKVFKKKGMVQSCSMHYMHTKRLQLYNFNKNLNLFYYINTVDYLR